MDDFIFVVNPGKASRRYSVFKGGVRLVELHFEIIDQKVICTIRRADEVNQAIIHINNLNQAFDQVFEIFDFYNIDIVRSDITKIALKVSAPTNYFGVHRLLDEAGLARLEELADPELMGEISNASRLLPHSRLVGISDSAFHSTVPSYVVDYRTRQMEPKPFFGRSGISAGSVVNQLRSKKQLRDRVVVCHLGHGASVTALKRGKSVDTVDVVVDTELNLRNRLTKRRQGNQRATEVVEDYIYSIQQAIGQMVASLGGIDSLVLTGAVGETSTEIRSLLLPKLAYLGLEISSDLNHKTHIPDAPAEIGKTDSANLLVVSAKEDFEMARMAEIIR